MPDFVVISVPSKSKHATLGPRIDTLPSSWLDISADDATATAATSGDVDEDDVYVDDEDVEEERDGCHNSLHMMDGYLVHSPNRAEGNGMASIRLTDFNVVLG